MKPAYDRIIVIPEEKNNNVTIAGQTIEVVGSTENTRTTRGIVSAMGPGRIEHGTYVPMPCEVGDTVVYGKFAGEKFEHAGEELFVIRSNDVVAVLEEDDE